MGIDFHHPDNAGAYATRRADDGWRRAIRRIVDPAGLRVVDVGCGGGIYSTALAEMGAASVTGVDSSAQMIADARQRSTEEADRQRDGDAADVVFRQGEAHATGLPDVSADLVLQRALVHHIDDPTPVFAEAGRILAPGGALLVQDRTIEDVVAPASAMHFRGAFFELYPRLAEIEARRRPTRAALDEQLRSAGLTVVGHHHLSERRRSYSTLEELHADLMSRTGRSILHELDDAELRRLADHICAILVDSFRYGEPIHEVDHWTIWHAQASFQLGH
ncbi:class I SAM-dependent methyltransferase [Citricoccus sp. GCM10030269]|uniref:class I SAM-dependent methyltransferase n=1 Tax=Citricoccus sp. GCM10030269 TaxID=3273388 RepID=UPI0036142D9D